MDKKMVKAWEVYEMANRTEYNDMSDPNIIKWDWDSMSDEDFDRLVVPWIDTYTMDPITGHLTKEEKGK